MAKPIGRAKTASKIGLTARQAELLKNLEAQHPSMRAALEKYEISTKGIPTWERVKMGLTQKVLSLSLKLAEPDLILVPPVSRELFAKAINQHPVKAQRRDTYIYEPGNEDLWNTPERETQKKWRVFILDGIENVQDDTEIYDGIKSNYEVSREWLKKYRKQGLDVMNDADSYLALMIKKLAQGKLLDTNFWTELNAKNLTPTSDVTHGEWWDGQVYLGLASYDRRFHQLRLRGSVKVV